MNERPPSIPPALPPARRFYVNRSPLIVFGAVLGILGWLYILHVLDRNHMRNMARAAVCLSNVRAIGLACEMYARDNGGRLPPTAESLYPYLHQFDPYSRPNKCFICPSAKDKSHSSYAFTGATNLWRSNPAVIVLRETAARHFGKRSVLFDDGRVEQQ
ncbi:MAG TPA: hypothetical protein VL486_09815 [Verrucomicrobiae bacterium]|nr:hypothetical protein [Verrucomicrobiae bacterium]